MNDGKTIEKAERIKIRIEEIKVSTDRTSG
jgi:hypothetical protein